MNIRTSLLLIAFGALAAGCSDSSPSEPSAASDSSTTASIAAPRPVGPTNGASIANASQPLSLTVQNGTSTKTDPLTYTFDVAFDSSFTTKIQTKDGVAEGSGGQTTVRLDTLPAGTTYYWRARSSGGGTTGAYGSTFRFSIGPAFSLSTPGLVAPSNGFTTAGWPAFTVTNSQRSGPITSVSYVFEVSTSASFNPLLLSSTVPEQPSRTTFSPRTFVAPPSQTLFWRVTAIDPNLNVSSTTSTAQTFTPVNTNQSNLATLLGLILWPGAQPTGTYGHATMGGAGEFGVGWGIQSLYYAPGNVVFQSPDIEMLRYFDLWDRGFDPVSATDWLNANGYPTIGLWYPPPEKAVLGLQYVYIAARNKVVTNATWDIVLRVE